MSLLAGTWVCPLVKGVTLPLAGFCGELVRCKLSLVCLLEKKIGPNTPSERARIKSATEFDFPKCVSKLRKCPFKNHLPKMF